MLSDSLVKVDRGITSLIAGIQRQFDDVNDNNDTLKVDKDGSEFICLIATLPYWI